MFLDDNNSGNFTLEKINFMKISGKNDYVNDS